MSDDLIDKGTEAIFHPGSLIGRASVVILSRCLVLPAWQ